MNLPLRSTPASHCSRCRFRARYDRDPQSRLGRLWLWHTQFCPGWRAYLRTLPPATREELELRYAWR